MKRPPPCLLAGALAGAVAVSVSQEARAQIFAPPANISKTPDNMSTETGELFVDGAGNIAVVWEEATGDPEASERDVFVSFSSAFRISFTAPVNVSEHRNVATDPEVLIDANGTVYVVWSTTKFGGRKVGLGISTNSGQTLETRAITESTAFHPDIAAGPDGEIYVAWSDDEDDDALGDEIFLIRSDDGGASFTSAVNVSDTAGRSMAPIVGVDAVGQVYVLWEDRSDGLTGVVLARAPAGGEDFGFPVLLPGSSDDSRGTNMAVDADGNVNAIWSEGNDWIQFARSTDQGETFTADLVLIGPAQMFGPDVTVDRAGNVFTVYASGTIDDRQVFYSPWLDFGLYTFGSAISDDVGFAGHPNVAVDGASNIDITWLESTVDNFWYSREVFFTHPPIPNFRFLFVPVGAWGPTIDEAIFYAGVIYDQVGLLQRDLPLEACGDLVEITFLYPTEAVLDDFTCTTEPLDCNSGAIRDFAEAQGLDPDDYDMVVGVLPAGGSPCAPAVGCREGDTLWMEIAVCPVLAHETGHVYGLSEEYCSIPAGSPFPGCNDGGPAFGGNDINFLGADESCDPRADLGCCGDCSDAFVCCEGNVDVAGGRSLMSYCGASDDQTWEARSIAHLTFLADFRCEYAGVKETSLALDVEIPEDGRPVLNAHTLKVARPTRNQGMQPEGDTELSVRYRGGSVIFADRFPAIFEYDGPAVAGVDYSSLRREAIRRFLRVPVSYAETEPRPTTLEILRSGTVAFRGTIFGSAPVADAGPDQTVECTGDLSASITLDGTGSSDADDDLIFHSWSWLFGTSSGATPTVTFPLGTTEIALVVDDGVLASTPDVTQVTVEDTEPPTLEVSVEPATLWPPNHRLARVEASATVSDVCDPSPDVVLTSITSSQPDDGLGDGDTADDIQQADIGTFDTTFLLRAERAGTIRAGRTYTITYTATDVSGNSTEATAVVTVAHNQ